MSAVDLLAAYGYSGYEPSTPPAPERMKFGINPLMLFFSFTESSANLPGAEILHYSDYMWGK